MQIGSLFSGVGGLELGLEWSGLGHTVWQSEKDPFCRRVLEKHWPGVRRYSDVREIGKHNTTAVDLLCGGFPCQDLSSAGARKGLAGERSGLWCEFARIVGELRPRWTVVENVFSGATQWVDHVCSSLAALGYETLPVPLSAKDVGAPHRRSRIFIIANTDRYREPTVSKHAEAPKLQLPSVAGWLREQAPFPGLLRMDDGSADRVDRLRACGNAVVPHCSEVIGYMIQQLDSDVARP